MLHQVLILISIVNFSATEFVFDFASVMPGLEKAKVNSRIF